MQSSMVLRTWLLALAVLASLCICGVALPQGVAVALPSSPPRDQLRARIEAAKVPSTVSIQREFLHAWELLVRFYVQRAFQPAWIGEDGLLQHTGVFVQTLCRSAREGLKPITYHLSTVGQEFSQIQRQLNVPVGVRMRQIELNMERWRWLPRDLGDRYILVNIANFTLDVVEEGQSVLSMRVVAGKPTRRTPFFSAEMTYLVLSPHWYVPPTIAIQDKLPLIRRDPSYAARQNLKIFRDGPGGAICVDPRAIDWSSVSARNFPYRLRQDPGPRNALGRVKFMFPNPYHVYLHDTPSRQSCACGACAGHASVAGMLGVSASFLLDRCRRRAGTTCTRLTEAHVSSARPFAGTVAQ
jgi:murein L,D-transpeptidase YcbB/YkuD